MMEQPPQKIAVFRALQLGDMLCVIPAIRALRKVYPDAEITLLGLPWAGAFVQRFYPYFDRFIHFPGYPGLPEQEYDESAFRHFMEEMQAESFDLLLQMQGNGTIVNQLLSTFNAAALAGFHNKDSRMDSPLFLEYPEYTHEIEKHCALMRHLGIPAADKELEFPLLSQDYHELARMALPLRPGRYVCVHPGSRGSWRQWPPQYFALLADHCAEKGLDLVIT
ncbi:MAG TPA: glycosyltransferase family 9 protein, partial [Puia sp.]|nr:glycosyltransferase family 9 protein [Puia sp.]